MWDTNSSSDGLQENKQFMDGSGWTVSTGNATRAAGGDRVQSGDPMSSAPTIAAAGGSNTLLLVGGAGLLMVLVFVLMKRKRK